MAPLFGRSAQDGSLLVLLGFLITILSRMLSWLRPQGFKNTFTAASHPHACTCIWDCLALSQLDRRWHLERRPEVRQTCHFASECNFSPRRPRLPSLSELDRVVAPCPAFNSSALLFSSGSILFSRKRTEKFCAWRETSLGGLDADEL